MTTDLNHALQKTCRFIWRASRNAFCLVPWGKRLLFPPKTLSVKFGRSDADYAIDVFIHHYRQLDAAGFRTADRIMEVGPGRNLGTPLLMWVLNYSRLQKEVKVTLWDVYPNMVVNEDNIRQVAGYLLESKALRRMLDLMPGERIDELLKEVVAGRLNPDFRYEVKELAALIEEGAARENALVYSQAAIEHIWDVDSFWRGVIPLTKAGGWHSHRIDLADHGRRHDNYLEMLQWSWLGYWLTMRFVPGAINRWRASNHLEHVAKLGLRVVWKEQETRPALPVPRSALNRRFRQLDEADLKTTALDFVATRTA